MSDIHRKNGLVIDTFVIKTFEHPKLQKYLDVTDPLSGYSEEDNKTRIHTAKKLWPHFSFPKEELYV